MVHCFQDLNLSQRGNRHAFLLIVHQYAFQRDGTSGSNLDCFMNLTGNK